MDLDLDRPSPEQSVLPSVEIIGTAIASDHDIAQSTDTIDRKDLTEQNLTLLQDALRNAPGITLNAGEGGSHGDSVNLRGLSIPDSFFLDGVRDIGQYQRDTFNTDAVSVLLGPASALFGRGSTSGVINTISRQPLLTPLAALSVSAGQADFWRGTADLNLPLGGAAAARLTVMDQHNHIVERDQVTSNRYGVAPTFAFGINTPTRLTLSYFKEVENNLPDYGIPFIDGAPAHVERSNYYGLVNYDRTRTNNSIGTLRFEHDFAGGLTVSDSLRYATYGFNYLVTGPFLGNDFVAPPPPATPLSDIVISRDQPSSGGDTNMLINRTDLAGTFELAGLRHTLTGGLELSKENSNVTRFQNGLNDIAPTPILVPDPLHTPATPLVVYSAPQGRGDDVSVYAADSIALGTRWDLDAALRWDRFHSSFSEAFSGTGFTRTDTFISPRVAAIVKPDDAHSYYLSYGTSYNPVIEYLIVAPSNDSLAPEKNTTVELGAKIRILGGAASVSGALFDTRVSNARISDPDDPTVQQAPFDQQVKGVEIGINGYLTKIWEVTANYTHLNARITATSDPLSQGRLVPNIPHDAANIWSVLDPAPAISIGAGATAVSHRYADTGNTAGVPGYVVFNAMASYQVNDHLKLQLNLNNLGNRLYFTSIYYVDSAENHALPAAGRTLIATVSWRL